MGQQTIGDYIRGIDFLTAKKDYEEDEDNPEIKLRDFESKCKGASLDEIADGYAAFGSKLGVSDLPCYGSAPYWLGYTTACVLDDLVNYNDEADTKAGEMKVGHAQFGAWLSLLGAGPNTGHLDLMDKLRTKHCKTYLQNCSKEDLQNILPRLKIPVKYDADRETQEEQTYASFLADKMKYFYSTISEGQLQQVQLEFLDVMGHFLQLQPSLSPTLCQYIGYFIRDMTHNFPEENAYIGLKQVEPMKHHISIIQTISTSAPAIKDLAVERVLTKILKASMKNNQAADLFESIRAMLIALAERKDGPEDRSIILDCVRIQYFRETSLKPSADMCKGLMEVAVVMTTDRSPVDEYWHQFVKEALELFFKNCAEMSSELLQQTLKMITNLVNAGQDQLVSIATDTLKRKPFVKYIKWKDYITEAKNMVRAIQEVPVFKMEKDKGDYSNAASEYERFLETLFKQLSKAKALQLLQKDILQCALVVMETEPVAKEKIGSVCVNSDYIDLTKVDSATIHDALVRCHKLLTTSGEEIFQRELSHVLSHLMLAIIQSYSGNTKLISDEDHELIESMILTTLAGESLEDRLFPPELDIPYQSPYYALFICVVPIYITMHTDSSAVGRCLNILKAILRTAKLAFEEDNADFLRYCFNCLCWVGVHPSQQLVTLLPDLVDMFLQVESKSDLFTPIYNLYQHDPATVNCRLQEICDQLDDVKGTDGTYLINIITQVASLHPEAFEQAQVDTLFRHMMKVDSQSQLTYLGIFLGLASKRGSMLDKYFNQFLDDNLFAVKSLCIRSGIIANLAVDEAKGAAAIDYLMKYINHADQMVSGPVLGQMTLLVRAHTEYMQIKYKTDIETLLKNTADTSRKQNVQFIMDVLDGKSIDNVIEEVQEHKEQLADLDVKVGATMNTVIVIGDKVVEHDKEISTMQKGLGDLEEKVEVVETDVGETKQKLEEVDNKTMTNAPRWSRDLTKLMNPTTENDWRLLASRLGYNNDDIRAWSSQNDPCMALLSDWYATHRTSEATYGVLTALQEIDRLDGAIIVENAMKSAEDVVEDEDFEYASPPKVFLSYQWGVQPEVKLLRQHLMDAGYTCWMDIGQMGGGDKLFSKIDSGIRGATVVVSCVTEKYSQSPNCNREVNLAVTLNKPIIPLQMEKMNWPPKGAMGPIFSEYVFIRFFQRPQEATEDNRYWPIPKFQELLMQLNYYVAPDQALVTQVYANWWKPIAEEIVIDKTKGNSTSDPAAISKQLTSQPGDSPLVFLSYQWGKQPEVRALYQRLVSLGYTVWMDIYQMGGGDSLYDKIDRGLRGCKVVVSCVTPKYALSANCRREISLADALKRPIIPLLMEQMKWPPDGPMSMVFTELLFINVYRNAEIQTTWSGDKFNELIDKIKSHIGEHDDKQKIGDTGCLAVKSSDSIGVKAVDELGSNPAKDSDKGQKQIKVPNETAPNGNHTKDSMPSHRDGGGKHLSGEKQSGNNLETGKSKSCTLL